MASQAEFEPPTICLEGSRGRVIGSKCQWQRRLDNLSPLPSNLHTVGEKPLGRLTLRTTSASRLSMTVRTFWLSQLTGPVEFCRESPMEMRVPG